MAVPDRDADELARLPRPDCVADHVDGVGAHLRRLFAQPLLDIGLLPQLSVRELKRFGVMPAAAVDEGAKAALFTAEAASGPLYWLGLNNFYVITRYNRSINYALVVQELARELRAQVKPEV